MACTVCEPQHCDREKESKMAKCMLLWELDQTKIAEDPKARATAWNQLVGMVKQDLEKGITKDWGAILGQMGGYMVVEGAELDIAMMVQQYTPFVKFTTHPIMDVKGVEDMLRAMTDV
jgi:hypothetical protein